MKKMKGAFLLLLSFFLSITSANAACSTTLKNQLNAEAVNVKANYEEITEVMDPDNYGLPDGTDDNNLQLEKVLFKVNINNLTENLYLTVFNSATNETKTYTYADSENGTISFNWDDLYTMVNYTITVYGSNKTDCADTKLHTLYLTTPMLNEYSSLSACDGLEKFYLCYKYTTTDQVDFNTFISRVEEYKKGQINEQGEEPKKEQKEDKKEYKKPIIIGSILSIVVVGGIIVIIVKKQRSKK